MNLWTEGWNWLVDPLNWPGVDGIGNEASAIDPVTGAGQKDITRLHLAGIDAQPADFDAFGGEARQDALGLLLERHAHMASRTTGAAAPRAT